MHASSRFVENKMSPILLITMVTATIVRTRALNAASRICVTLRDAVKKVGTIAGSALVYCAKLYYN